MVARVLVVEDDSTVSSVLYAYLRKSGFDPRIAPDGAAALQEWTQWKPDIVILDVMLPGMTGLEVLHRRRADDDGAAVIILSARGDEEDRLLGLEMGADDYVVKPFSPREAVLRVQALLRRSERLGARSMLPRTVTVGELLVDLQARTARIRDDVLGLTHREFDLLAFLITHRNEAFTKEALMHRVWGWDFGDTSTVTVHVRRLREKIERDPSDPRLVLTVRGTGYRFDGEASR
jgi:DNA-binding response OmpR family regulator